MFYWLEQTKKWHQTKGIMYQYFPFHVNQNEKQIIYMDWNTRAQFNTILNHLRKAKEAEIKGMQRQLVL